MSGDGGGLSAEQDFARRFAEVWAKPAPEKLAALLHENVVLLQPHLPPIRGRTAAFDEMRRLLDCGPELHGEVIRATGADGIVFIEWRVKLTADHKGIPAVDRFFIDGGLARERLVYFDQLALITALLVRPRLWPGFIRYRFGR
jgi:hypothetical protein